LLDNAVNAAEMNDEWKKNFRSLLISYKDVFSKKHKVTNLIQHTIDIVDDKPFFRRLRPMSEEDRKAFCELVQRMEAEGLIERAETRFMTHITFSSC